MDHRTPLKWQTRRQRADVHVTPIRDLREHTETRECWCVPVLHDEGEGYVVVHNSADGRELIERHGIN